MWQLVRASTAAPTFFPPEVVTLADGKPRPTFVFVDGGVTTYNNPAFLAFQMATAAPYRLNWATGATSCCRLGRHRRCGEGTPNSGRDMHLIYNASAFPWALMNAAAAGWDMACRMLGDCRLAAHRSEFG